MNQPIVQLIGFIVLLAILLATGFGAPAAPVAQVPSVGAF